LIDFPLFFADASRAMLRISASVHRCAILDATDNLEGVQVEKALIFIFIFISGEP
jgi:hypothetical protein